MAEENFSNVDELFGDLEKHFKNSRLKEKRKTILVAVLLVVSLFALVWGISISFVVSFLGYLGLLVSTLFFVNKLREKIIIVSHSTFNTIVSNQNRKRKNTKDETGETDEMW